jgi:hypothetical protein
MSLHCGVEGCWSSHVHQVPTTSMLMLIAESEEIGGEQVLPLCTDHYVLHVKFERLRTRS